MLVTAPLTADPPSSPQLSRTLLRIEPTAAQVETMEPTRPQWSIAPAIVTRFDAILTAGNFNPEVAAVRAHPLVGRVG